MVNLGKKVLLDSDRKYIVQTLATVLMTYVPRPSLDCCSTAAKSLITKYPVLKDADGDGEVQIYICMCFLSPLNFVCFI